MRGRSTWSGWYTQQAWLDARARQLGREPMCRVCSSVGLVEVAVEVDHVKPHRGDRRLFFDGANLQSLCHSCHSRKTAREIAGHYTEVDRPACARVVCVDAGPGQAGDTMSQEARQVGWVVVDLRGVAGRARLERWNEVAKLFQKDSRVLVLYSMGSWQDRAAWVEKVGDGVDRVLVSADPWTNRRTEGRSTVRLFSFHSFI